jgi:hypothetical protein
MKFFLTLNIPTKNGMSHMIVGEHPAKSIEEFQEALHREDFLLVEEWQPQDYGEMRNEGKLLLNHQLIGKVRVYKPR